LLVAFSVIVVAVPTKLLTASSGVRRQRSVSENRASALMMAARSCLSWAISSAGSRRVLAIGSSAWLIRPNRRPGRCAAIADPRGGRAYAAAIPLDRRIGDLMRVGALNGAPSMRTNRNIRQMLALRISGGGERADGSGKIQVERRVDRRGHDISCCQGMSGARRAPGLER